MVKMFEFRTSCRTSAIWQTLPKNLNHLDADVFWSFPGWGHAPFDFPPLVPRVPDSGSGPAAWPGAHRKGVEPGAAGPEPPARAPVIHLELIKDLRWTWGPGSHILGGPRTVWAHLQSVRSYWQPSNSHLNLGHIDLGLRPNTNPGGFGSAGQLAVCSSSRCGVERFWPRNSLRRCRYGRLRDCDGDLLRKQTALILHFSLWKKTLILQKAKELFYRVISSLTLQPSTSWIYYNQTSFPWF